ncbi:hypothetical protein R3P38DRAFT_3276245 [Favolaschia claudopus]|uniref:Uncharacterized protein n=1 Tax=Favolaschia claudopus TaxID=2862362 RepID=A0AAW0ASC6_9AGAR
MRPSLAVSTTTDYNHNMKLIVASATGFIRQEVIRQSLRNPAITSIVVLGGQGSEQIDEVKEYGDYPDEVRKDFFGADACIWSVDNVLATKGCAISLSRKNTHGVPTPQIGQV